MEMSLIFKVITILLLFDVCVESKLLHTYYSLQTVEQVDTSQSYRQLNKCKQQCLQMKDYFPFSFRYHRIITRQTQGMAKYFTGNCQIKMLTQQYQQWSNLKLFIDSSNLFGDADIKNKGQLTVWQSYNNACENIKLKLSKQQADSLNLVRVHSDFYYYDNGQFQNSQPFDDIGEMLQQINGMN